MKRILLTSAVMLSVAVSLPGVARGQAAIPGVSGPQFTLKAAEDFISTGDGGSLLIWGLGNQGGGTRTQLPAPTLIVNQGETVTVTLNNTLPEATSLIFPGQRAVQAAGGVAGVLTQEAPPGGTVTYTFVASQPGTYLYQSGTHMDLQVELGLVGALVVRPNGYNGATHRIAYEDESTLYDHEYLFLLNEIDPQIHRLVEQRRYSEIDLTRRHPTYWLINGRCGPDTMLGSNLGWLPTQPYSSLARMHPGERVLMRVIGGGRDLHPFHHHGNHAAMIARDGRLLESVRGETGPDLALDVFTISSAPGGTHDQIFTWTGEGLGWDIYGHTSSDPLSSGESSDDHGKPLPVRLPDVMNLIAGPMYSGSPYLGTMGTLPPGEGGMNANAGYFYMWHSHTEMELINDNIFPGGMMTMMIVEPPGVPIP